MRGNFRTGSTHGHVGRELRALERSKDSTAELIGGLILRCSGFSCFGVYVAA